MCIKKYHNRIDECLRNAIEILNLHDMKTVASCCGHGKYPMTIVVNSLGSNYELFSGKHIPRKRRFYKKDDKGIYYIPEIVYPEID